MKSKQSESNAGIGTKLMGFLVKLFIPIMIIAAATTFFVVQMKTRPLAKRTPPKSLAKKVQVHTVNHTQVRVVVEDIQGPVIPAQAVTLSPQVSGLIVTLSPDVIPGGIVSRGQDLLGIEASDYRLAVQQRQSDVAQARLKLELERGNQTIARQEYEMLNEEISEEDRALVLREPHLVEAQASLEAAQAAVRRAELDLSRCEVAAPFNAVVQEKQIDLGTRVSPGSSLISLVGTDEYWVAASVPVRKLRWIKAPSGQDGSGSRVKIYDPDSWGPGLSREGVVIRLLSDIEQEGLMARLLVSIKDPLALKPENKGKPVVLLGSRVDVEIQGEILESVIPLQREWLRSGDYVWLMTEDNALKIQPVETSFRGKEQVCVVSGLADGQQVVLTDIAAPVEGMPLEWIGQVAIDPNQPLSQARQGE